MCIITNLTIVGCGSIQKNSVEQNKLEIKSEDNSQQDINTIKDESNIVVNLKNKIHSTLPEYIFKIYGKKSDSFYGASKIQVYKVGTKDELIQEITFNETTTPTAENLGFIVEDMNFDGYKDIRIQETVPAGPNIPYYYWLWDTKTSKYVENKDLEKITSPEFDQHNDLIKSYVRDSANTYYDYIYKYINSIPTLIKETERVGDIDKKVWHVTIKELKNNKLEIVKKYDEPLENLEMQ